MTVIQKNWQELIRPEKLQVAAGGDAKRIATVEANDVLLVLSRLLVPLNYQRGTRWRRDLGLTTQPLPALAICAELDRYPPNVLGFALTHLMRGLNQVVATLEEANARVEATLPATQSSRKRAG